MSKVMGRRRTILAAVSGMLMAVCMFVSVSRLDQPQELEALGVSGVSMDKYPTFARFEQLAYKFTPEDNPLEDFDKDFKAQKYSYKEDENPFKDFNGYGFSTQTHAKGVSPYPPSSKEDAHNVFESLPAKFPFDERKDGLNEVMHPWQHFDWKQSPSDAIKEANVWDTKGADSADSAWQLGDKMSFKWHHWEDGTLDQDSPSKALKETNVWDSAKLWPVNGYKWAATAASVVQDNNEADKPGTEKNVLMNYKFPNY